jgi:cytochrome b pre-mRNA-processing protein 3
LKGNDLSPGDAELNARYEARMTQARSNSSLLEQESWYCVHRTTAGITPRLRCARGGSEAKMGIRRWFAPRPAAIAGKALYARAAAQARDPAFYADLGVADTVEGRFELFSLHVALILLRLKGEGQAAAEISQAAFDAFLGGLDSALRELAVGDLAVPKRMKKLGEAFYGRMRSLEQALAARPDLGELETVVARTLLQDSGRGRPEALAAYIAAAADRLAGIPVEELLQGRADWPEAAP